MEVGGNNGVVGRPSLGREVESSATCGTPRGIYRLQKEPCDSNQRLSSSPSFLPVDDGQREMKMNGSWFKNYEEFQDSRALGQAWGASGPGALCDRTGQMTPG